MKSRALAVGSVRIGDAMAALTSGDAPVAAVDAAGSPLGELKMVSVAIGAEQLDVTTFGDQFARYVSGPLTASVRATIRSVADPAALLDSEIELDQVFGQQRLRGRMRVTSASWVWETDQMTLDMRSVGAFVMSNVSAIDVAHNQIAEHAEADHCRALALDGKIS